MSKYLVSVTETYRIDSEKEAAAFIEQAKQDDAYILGKYSSEFKERKLKGEVIDCYYKVTLTKIFNEIKDPITYVKVYYDTEG